MSHEHQNISILKKFDPTNIAACKEVLAEDVIFHYFNPNLPNLSKDYVGREGIEAFFKKIAQFSKGTFKTNPVSAQTFGDELVVVHSINTLSKEREDLAIDVAVVWRIVNDKIKEVWDIVSGSAKEKELHTTAS